ncbi:MAG TPA: hypothetical protein VGJ95_06125, partial [Pseudonocardiaceae bacterium]
MRGIAEHDHPVADERAQVRRLVQVVAQHLAGGGRLHHCRDRLVPRHSGLLDSGRASVSSDAQIMGLVVSVVPT